MSAAPDYDIPQEPSAIEADLLALTAATDRINEDSVSYLAAHTDDLAALSLLFLIREARQQLADVEATVEAEAARRMPAQKVIWPGFIAERKGGADRKAWQHDRLAWAVTSQLIINPDTGEVDEHDRELVDKVRSELLNAAAISYWRTTQLKRLGIDPADYCETTTGRRTVHVRRAVDE